MFGGASNRNRVEMPFWRQRRNPRPGATRERGNPVQYLWSDQSPGGGSGWDDEIRTAPQVRVERIVTNEHLVRGSQRAMH